MLIDLFPRVHARFIALPLLGPLLDGLARWLVTRGFPDTAIRGRIRKAPVLEALLRRRGVRDFSAVSHAQLLALTARKSQQNIYLSALVRSLAAWLSERGMLAARVATRGERLAGAYRKHLGQVRGLAASTQALHHRTALELLAFLHFDRNPAVLGTLDASRLEAFLKSAAAGCANPQHKASFLRSFVRFLVGRGEVAAGLDAGIDSPRVRRGERLPRALPWDTVQAFLAGIGRTTAKGRRDYAMFLLMATYGLRTSEVAALRLDDIGWRAAEFRVQRPKVLAPINLPLTSEVGAALVDYLRNSRWQTAHRAVFLRVRRPVAPLSPGGILNAFYSWQRRGDFPAGGAHCLRHSLAMHLLRRNTSVKTIGDLLGHRSLASTGAYLRLHADDLRAAALELPVAPEAGQ